MPNSLIDAYRQNMAAQGQPDTRDDYFVMQDLIPLAQQNPQLLTDYPDFAQEYGAYRDAAAPSLAGEFTRSLKAGTEEAGSTYAGLGALADIPGAAGAAKNLQADAAENTPTIGSMEDIAPGQTGLSRVFSKDALRYAVSKAGGAIPSMAEMVGTGLAGAAVGSAIEPGLGTLAGAGEGIVEGFLDRGIIKSAIKSVVEAGGEEAGLTEQGVKDAILSGDQKLADTVSQEAKAIAAGRAEAGTNLANVYAMSAGGIYNDTGDRGEALGIGALAALTAAPPFISLPAKVAKTIFPRLSAEAAQSAAEDLVGKKTAELLAKVGRAGEASAVGTAGVVGLEAANIVAKNLSQGKDALDLDDSDWKRLREAAVGGAIGSLLFAALAARSPDTGLPGDLGTKAPLETTPAAAADVPLEAEAPPPPATVPSSTDVTRAVAAMSDDQKRARLRMLSAANSRTPAEETEFAQLAALTPREAAPPPAPAPVVVPAAVEAPVAPPEPTPTIPAPVAAPEAPAPEVSAPSDQVSYKDAGFETPQDFATAYATYHLSEHAETEDEFIRRIFCSSQAA